MSYCLHKLLKQIIQQRASRRNIRDVETSSEASEDIGIPPVASVHIDDANKEKGMELLLFDFGVISAATNNFTNKNILGKGGFGPVYKGKLPGGQEIAVKRLSKVSGQGSKEFKNEVLLISKLQHRNLVRLLGCCTNRKEKLLLYEFMPNKSLDAFIFDPTKHGVLEWAKRYHIIEGIARGLLYLHRDSRLKIIHRDLKASNILLDEQFNPKISDFGLARIFGGDQITNTTRKVVGTIGYISPEYAMEGQYSEKSDVFSFGVLLLEIVSGRRNNCFHDDEESSLSLLGHVWRLWKENKVMEMIDPSLGDSYSHEEVLKCIKVGLLCVQQYPEDRPTMASVVLMLSNNVNLPPPKQPGFFGRSTPDTTSSREQNKTSSINDLSITEMECR